MPFQQKALRAMKEQSREWRHCCSSYLYWQKLKISIIAEHEVVDMSQLILSLQKILPLSIKQNSKLFFEIEPDLKIVGMNINYKVQFPI